MSEKAVVVDIGSENTRFGWSGSSLPDVVFKTGSPPATSCDGADGSAAASTPPVVRGVVQDWDGVEAVIAAGLEEMQVKGSEQPLLLADAITTTDAQRERMAELLFEKFDVPALFFGYQPVLGVYSCGRVSSIVLDCGSGVTHAMAVHEGFAFPHTIMRLGMGGADVTKYLHSLLAEREVLPDDPEGMNMAEAIKIRLGRVANDFAQEAAQLRAKQLEERIFELPDGRKVDVGDAGLRCGEALFQPALVGVRGDSGIAEMLSEIIRICDADRDNSQLKALATYVIAIGGSSLLGNLDWRLSAELTERSTYKRDVLVSALQQPERWHAAWVGGSIVAALPSFVDNNFVARAEWDDQGGAAVHKRC